MLNNPLKALKAQQRRALLRDILMITGAMTWATLIGTLGYKVFISLFTLAIIATS